MFWNNCYNKVLNKKQFKIILTWIQYLIYNSGYALNYLLPLNLEKEFWGVILPNEIHFPSIISSTCKIKSVNSATLWNIGQSLSCNPVLCSSIASEYTLVCRAAPFQTTQLYSTNSWFKATWLLIIILFGFTTWLCYFNSMKHLSVFFLFFKLFVYRRFISQSWNFQIHHLMRNTIQRRKR